MAEVKAVSSSEIMCDTVHEALRQEIIYSGGTMMRLSELEGKAAQREPR